MKFTLFESRKNPMILAYHSIDETRDDPNRLNTSAKRFRQHLKYLSNQGLHGVSMVELLSAFSSGQGGNLVGLTFDDGYKDFHTTAVPILQEFGFSATVFVLSGLLGMQNDWVHHIRPHVERRLMSADEMREVASMGMEVGSHYVCHDILTTIPVEDLRGGLISSRRELENIVGEGNVRGFCYPYGIVNAEVASEVKEAGYEYACSLTKSVGLSGFDLSRVPFHDRDNLVRFSLKWKTYPTYRKIQRTLGLGGLGDERLWS